MEQKKRTGKDRGTTEGRNENTRETKKNINEGRGHEGGEETEKGTCSIEQNGGTKV